MRCQGLCSGSPKPAINNIPSAPSESRIDEGQEVGRRRETGAWEAVSGQLVGSDGYFAAEFTTLVSNFHFGASVVFNRQGKARATDSVVFTRVRSSLSITD